MTLLEPDVYVLVAPASGLGERRPPRQDAGRREVRLRGRLRHALARAAAAGRRFTDAADNRYAGDVYSRVRGIGSQRNERSDQDVRRARLGCQSGGRRARPSARRRRRGRRHRQRHRRRLGSPPRDLERPARRRLLGPVRAGAQPDRQRGHRAAAAPGRRALARLAERLHAACVRCRRRRRRDAAGHLRGGPVRAAEGDRAEGRRRRDRLVHPRAARSACSARRAAPARR